MSLLQQEPIYQPYPLLFVDPAATLQVANVLVYYGRAVTIVTDLQGTPLIITSDIFQYLYWLDVLNLRVWEVKYYVPVPGNAYQQMLERMN